MDTLEPGKKPERGQQWQTASNHQNQSNNAQAGSAPRSTVRDSRVTSSREGRQGSGIRAPRTDEAQATGRRCPAGPNLQNPSDSRFSPPPRQFWGSADVFHLALRRGTLRSVLPPPRGSAHAASRKSA